MSAEVRTVWIIESPGILALLDDWQRRGNLGCREVRLRPPTEDEVDEWSAGAYDEEEDVYVWVQPEGVWVEVPDE
jgi:hypothetical protein